MNTHVMTMTESEFCNGFFSVTQSQEFELHDDGIAVRGQGVW